MLMILILNIFSDYNLVKICDHSYTFNYNVKLMQKLMNFTILWVIIGFNINIQFLKL
jgi:hypothetical protein